MSHCPNCAKVLGYSLRENFIHGRNNPYTGPGEWLAFRCRHCGMKLGYRGLRNLVANLLAALPALAGCVAIYLLIPFPPPPGLSSLLVVLMVVGSAAGLVILLVVGHGLPAVLITPEVLPKEYQ